MLATWFGHYWLCIGAVIAGVLIALPLLCEAILE